MKETLLRRLSGLGGQYPRSVRDGARMNQEDIEEGMKKLKEEVACVRAIEMCGGMLNFGAGDVIADSAADESCWPVRHSRAIREWRRDEALR